MPRGTASAATSDAPYAHYLEKTPSAIHVRDAELINELVGKNVVTAKQVMFAKLLLMKTQAIRTAEKAGDAKRARSTAKAATTKPTTAKAAGTRGRTAAAKASPAKGGKPTTAKGRQRAKGTQAAASAESAPAADPTSDAPF